MAHDVLIKGNRYGLELIVNSVGEFDELLQAVEKKLTSAQDFFAKAPTPPQICLRGQALLAQEQKAALGELLGRFGLSLEERVEPVREREQPRLATPEYEIPAFFAAGEAVERPALFVYKTLRGGQEIRYHGSVVVLGDVNPGARIFAEGDILVTGSTRGVLHAGVFGDENTVITAGRLAGGQIRIAGCIARAPDQEESAQGPERARVCGDQIVIQTVNR